MISARNELTSSPHSAKLAAVLELRQELHCDQYRACEGLSILFDQQRLKLIKYQAQLLIIEYDRSVGYVNDLYWPTLNGTKATYTKLMYIKRPNAQTGL
jgi:hypothetical protein